MYVCMCVYLCVSVHMYTHVCIGVIVHSISGLFMHAHVYTFL